MVDMNNTHPEQIVDKNGITTTRHKRNVHSGLTRKLPSVKPITASARLSTASPEQKLKFDVATALAQEMLWDAQDITLDIIDDKVLLTEINGDPITESPREFLISSILDSAGMNEGKYKLSGALDLSKTQQAYTKYFTSQFGSTPSSEQLAESGLSELEGLAALTIARENDNPYHLDYMVSHFGNSLVQSAVVLNPATHQDTINSLEDSLNDFTRTCVARKTEDPNVVSRLMKDVSQSVRDDAIKNKLASTPDLYSAYNESRNNFSRANIIRHPNASQELIIQALYNDWSANVIGEALAKVDSEPTTKWANSAAKSFIKDDELKKISKIAGEYATSYSNYGDNTDKEKRILSDAEARAIAWRVTLRTKSNHTAAFTALDNGEDVDLQELVEEAARMKNTRMENRNYGFKWDTDNYMNAIIGWARTKQGR